MKIGQLRLLIAEAESLEEKISEQRNNEFFNPKEAEKRIEEIDDMDINMEEE